MQNRTIIIPVLFITFGMNFITFCQNVLYLVMQLTVKDMKKPQGNPRYITHVLCLGMKEGDMGLLHGCHRASVKVSSYTSWLLK